MVETKVTVKDETARLKAKAKAANIRSLGKVAAYVRTTARRLIRRQGKKGKPSSPGQPPKTKAGKMKDAILFSVNEFKDEAIVGVAKSRFGEAGKAHEHGGKFRGADYPKRPTMGPALEKSTDILPSFWQSSLRN